MSQVTYELYNALIQIGFDKQLASKVSKLINDREETGNFATKADINDLKTEARVITARLNMLTALNITIFASILIELLIQ